MRPLAGPPCWGAGAVPQPSRGTRCRAASNDAVNTSGSGGSDGSIAGRIMERLNSLRRSNPDNSNEMDWDIEATPVKPDQTVSDTYGGKRRPRPSYPKATVSPKQAKMRDTWLSPKMDAEEFRQDVFMSEEEANKLKETEALANQYESIQALKFVGFLVGVPILSSTLMGNFVFHPVLEKALHLSDESFPLTHHQEIHGAEHVRMEEMRMRMEIALHNAPEMTEEDMDHHLRHTALHELEHLREENMHGLDNRCRDGLSVVIFSMILMQETEGREFLFRTIKRFDNSLTDLGKAFIFILFADTFCGYHSLEGWTAGINILAEHWALEPKHSDVSIFVATVPVFVDSLLKLWLFSGFSNANPLPVIIKAMGRA